MREARRRIRELAEKGEASLLGFTRALWPVLEPGREMIEGWALEAIAEHLEGVSWGHIYKLLINVPPGFMKSLITNVFWPAWEWGPLDKPWLRYVATSYAKHLTERDNDRCRRLIWSDPYQEAWGERFQIRSDMGARVKFENDKTGFKLATGMQGIGAGERGDRFIMDDPHNTKNPDSDKIRDAAIQFVAEVMPTRVNDLDKSAFVIIMQRVHERDVSGYILSEELGYEHLMIPMEFEEERRCVTSIGWRDPRKRDGELAWPQRFSASAVAALKKQLKTFGTAGQLQQRPAPREGGTVKRAWFELVDAIPAGGRCVRWWDLAAGKKTQGTNPDWTAGVKMWRTREGIYIIEDVRRWREGPLKTQQDVKNTASQDGRVCHIGLYQDPGQAGKDQALRYVRFLAGYVVKTLPARVDKQMNGEAFCAQAEAGNVKLLRGDWNGPWLDEMTAFPSGANDDQWDGTAGAFNYLAGGPRGGSQEMPL